MSGLKFLYNLLLKNVVKEYGQVSGVMSIGNSVRKLADKKFQSYVMTAKKQGVDLDKLSEQEIKYMLQLNKPKPIKAISADSPEGKKITNDLFNMLDKQSGKNVIKTDFGKPFAEEVGGADNIIKNIKNMEPIDAMKEANSVIARKGKYKNLTPEESKKILKDTEDHIFERDIPIDPEDMADGGVAGLLGERTGFKWGGPGGKSPGTNTDGSAVGSGTKDNGGYQNVHQTGAVTQTPGRTVTPVSTGGPPSVLNPPTPPVTTGGKSPFAYTAPSVIPKGRRTPGGITSTKDSKILNWLKSKAGKYTGYTQHNINNQKLKLALDAGDITEEQYKLMGGYDVAQQLPAGIFDVPAVGIASGVYQLAKKGAGLINPDDPLSKYGKYGGAESMDLNMAGAQGLNRSDLQRYEAIVGGHQEVGGMLPGGHLPGASADRRTSAMKFGEGLYNTLNLADGGPARQNFGLGGMGRRAFLKWMAGTGAGIGAAKSGLFSLLKGGGKKEVIKELTQVPINNIDGMPVWFKPLVNKVIKEGDDVTKKFADADRQIVHTTKLPNSQTDVIVTQDLSTGNVSVDIGMGKHGFKDGHLGQPVRLEYKAAEDIMRGPDMDDMHKVGVRDPHIKVKRRDEMTFDQKKHPDKAPEEFWVEEAEFTGGHPENVKFEDVSYEKFGQHGSNFDEVEKFATGKVKKTKTTESRVFGKKYLSEGDDMASGGRVPLADGKKVSGRTDPGYFMFQDLDEDQPFRYEYDASNPEHMKIIRDRLKKKKQELIEAGVLERKTFSETDMIPVENLFLESIQNFPLEHTPEELEEYEKVLRSKQEVKDGGRVPLAGGGGILKILKGFLKKKPKKLETVKDFIEKRKFMKTIVGNSEKNKKARELKMLKDAMDEARRNPGFKFKDIDIDKEIRPIFDQSKDRKLHSTGGLAGMLGE